MAPTNPKNRACKKAAASSSSGTSSSSNASSSSGASSTSGASSSTVLAPQNKGNKINKKRNTSNAGARWTQQMRTVLFDMRNDNTCYEIIGEILGKTALACRLHFHHHHKKAAEHQRIVQAISRPTVRDNRPAPTLVDQIPMFVNRPGPSNMPGSSASSSAAPRPTLTAGQISATRLESPRYMRLRQASVSDEADEPMANSEALPSLPSTRSDRLTSNQLSARNLPNLEALAEALPTPPPTLTARSTSTRSSMGTLPDLELYVPPVRLPAPAAGFATPATRSARSSLSWYNAPGVGINASPFDSSFYGPERSSTYSSPRRATTVSDMEAEQIRESAAEALTSMSRQPSSVLGSGTSTPSSTWPAYTYDRREYAPAGHRQSSSRDVLREYDTVGRHPDSPRYPVHKRARSPEVDNVRLPGFRSFSSFADRRTPYPDA